MTTRVALVDIPALLVDVVRAALGEDEGNDVLVLPDGSTADAILGRDPDVVLVGVSDPSGYKGSERLLRSRPELTVFAISPDAREAWLHELTPTARSLAVLNGETLRAAVRDAAARGKLLRGGG